MLSDTCYLQPSGNAQTLAGHLYHTGNVLLSAACDDLDFDVWLLVLSYLLLPGCCPHQLDPAWEKGISWGLFQNSAVEVLSSLTSIVLLTRYLPRLASFSSSWHFCSRWTCKRGVRLHPVASQMLQPEASGQTPGGPQPSPHGKAADPGSLFYFHKMHIPKV